MVKKHRFFRGWQVGDYVITGIFIILCATMIIPFMNLVSLSMSSTSAILENKSMIFPKDLDLRAYKIILSSATIWRATITTFVTSILYTFNAVCFTFMSGFVLSREGLKGKKAMNLFLIITMVFGGGLVPYYLILKGLGFLNNYLVHIIPGTISAYNVFLVRNFIDRIPKSVQESAQLDGAGNMRMMVSILVPLSTPIIATIGILGLIGKWNDWYTAFMFIPDNRNYWLLQNIVRDYVVESSGPGSTDLTPTDNAVAYANAIMLFCTIPIICLYPFCLKYFTKGLYLGAVK